MTADILAAYADGDATDLEALRALSMQLGEVESDLEPLEAERKALRAQIEPIVLRLGGKASAAGFAHTITAPALTVNYDARLLDTIMAELMATGDVELMSIGARLAQARKTATRAGSLRISKEK
jgi:hypothetical protein